MKTKPILLATAGTTVDGRTITDKDLTDIVSSYNPKTYGARINIEHIRGMSGSAPFNAYGDVESVSLGEVNVDFNGKTEKRKALFGILDITDNAKMLNDAGQKVYPSIEIIDNFAGKGYSYLGGLAFTDGPSSIATERMKFNRLNPNNRIFSRDEGAVLEFEDESTSAEAKGMMASMGAMFDKFAATFAPPKVEDKTPPADPPKPATFDFSTLRPMFDEMVSTFNTTVEGMRREFREEIDGLALKLQKQSEKQENQPADHFSRRAPAGGGSAGNDDGVW